MSAWQQWLRQPQSVWLRRVVFQIHLWAGLAVGLYVVAISLSGAVLVYRTELYLAYSPQPVIVGGTGTALTPEQVTAVATRAYPGYAVADLRMGETPNHAVEVTLSRGADERLRRIFHPFTGADLGDPLPLGFRVTAWLLDLHDNLLNGETGRRVNGIGAISLILLCVTGAIIWWPGIRGWKRSLTIDRKAGWKRVNWSLHSALGFWFLLFLLMWGITGAYLSFPTTFAAFFDYIEPFDETTFEERTVDRIQYWLAYLHFGRLGGRGIPGCGREICNEVTKAAWALIALVPPAMFVTGTIMWWQRVVRPAMRRRDARAGMAAPRPVAAAADVRDL